MNDSTKIVDRQWGKLIVERDGNNVRIGTRVRTEIETTQFSLEDAIILAELITQVTAQR